MEKYIYLIIVLQKILLLIFFTQNKTGSIIIRQFWLKFFRSNIVNAPFPAEHPQNSHIPKFAVFPGQNSPDDTRNGRLALSRSTSLPSFAPSACVNYVVAEKISGSAHRREVVRVPCDSERRPLQWHGQSFNQVIFISKIDKKKRNRLVWTFAMSDAKCKRSINCDININNLGPGQTLNFSCAEPNSCIKLYRSATVWLG